MEILSAEQIKRVDELTITNEPINSIDLMERAAMACFRRLIKLINLDEDVFVFCGKGNNGGDGLAIARLMIEQGFDCYAVIVHYKEAFSPDAEQNYQRLKEKYPARIIEIHAAEELNAITSHGPIIVDALLGTGTKGPAEGLLAETIDFINTHSKNTISIDVPSGLLTDATSSQHKQVVASSLTLTFQLPKLAFLVPENQRFVPEFEILPIGLNKTAIQEQQSPYYYLTKTEISSLLQPRNKFSHKGSYGHALLMAGSKGKSGAALISAKAALRSGAGLLTLHSNRDTTGALLQHLPEAMSVTDPNPEIISEVDHPEKYDAIGFGPGVGTHDDTQQVLKKLLQYYTGKLLIDADGLNILSENKTWLSFLPPDTILTPHPKEFERLAGKQEDDFERLTELKKFSMKHRCIVVLKGAHSAVAMPDGTVFFNSSGNSGLAKGGSGDGLTGIILGLLARGYNAPQSALIGTFIHGFAADQCIKKKSMESLLISDVIEQLGKAFKKLES
jgi:hydroxyethylthiazole kinase-like uncharacterized protein yjeF